MAGTYIPPHMRKKQATVATTKDSSSSNSLQPAVSTSDDRTTLSSSTLADETTSQAGEGKLLYTHAEIRAHFWPAPSSSIETTAATDAEAISSTTSTSPTINTPNDPSTSKPESIPDSPSHASSTPPAPGVTRSESIPNYNRATGQTLHDSASSPGRLAYVFLFEGANPRWDEDGIVFTKSSLEILPCAIPPPAVREEGTAKRRGRRGGSLGEKGGSVGWRAGEGAGAGKGEGEVEGEGALGRSEVEAEGGAASTGDGNSPSSSVAKGGTQDDDPVSNKVATSTPPAVTPTSARTTEIDPSVIPHAPIAVFTQLEPSQIGRSFAFTGWYTVSRIAFAEPGSPELVRLLEQKWAVKDRHGRLVQKTRDEVKWAASLRFRWAVVKLVEVEESEKEGLGREGPRIERLEDSEGGDGERMQGGKGRKSVNELLREMRMGG